MSISLPSGPTTCRSKHGRRSRPVLLVLPRLADGCAICLDRDCPGDAAQLTAASAVRVVIVLAGSKKPLIKRT